jgi:hypothetical protein
MTTRHLGYLVPALLTATLLTLTACGGGSGGSQVASLDKGSSSATPSTAASGDLEKEVTAYVECLRKQGMDLPDPTVDAKGQISFGRPANGQTIDRTKLQAAQKVCGDVPAGVTAGLNLNDPALQDAALKFAQCMRGQGVDVPDPDVSKLGSGGNMFGNINRDDPKVAAGIKACQHVFTDAGVGPGGGGGN